MLNANVELGFGFVLGFCFFFSEDLIFMQHNLIYNSVQKSEAYWCEVCR